MKLEEAVALVIRRKRAELRISQEELADRANLDRTYVSAVERGLYNPTIKTLFAVAKAVKETPSDLIREVEVAFARRMKR